MVFDNETEQLVSFGTYENIEEAANTLIKDHIPKGRYGKIESSDFISEVRTMKQAQQLLKSKDINLQDFRLKKTKQ